MSALVLHEPLAAQGKGKGKGHSKGKSGAVAFSTDERRIIVQYYGGQGGHLPPELAKRGGDLPPGLAKQLQRNGTLPPGLQKKIEPIPPDLVRMLPPPPEGHRRVVVGTWALLIRDATNVVLDIIDLARN